LFGAGGQIGPDITGAQRGNLDYLIETMVDPSALVARDFKMEIIETTAGRVVTGLVTAESESSVTVETINERIVVPLDEIDTRTVSPLSIMPDGLLEQLSLDETKDLFAYLMGASQVEPAAQKTASPASNPLNGLEKDGKIREDVRRP
jgi:putative heme-binding domain-containing protein